MAGIFYLLKPRLLAMRNSTRAPDKKSVTKGAVFGVLGLSFWSALFALFYRGLAYFHATEAIGDLIAYRLLDMIFLSVFSVLVFSNIITALSTFYLSDEMTLILSSPSSKRQVYVYKFIETTLDSSWMVVVFGLPALLSYGLVYHAGAGYYLLAATVLVVFVLVPAPIGIAVTMALVKIFPAKRTKDIFLFLSVLLVVGLYFLFRFIQPEKLVDPEAFGAVGSYISSLAAPSAAYLPSHWAAETLWPLLTGRGSFGYIWPMALVSTAMAFFVLCGWLFGVIYHPGYSRAQEGGRYRTYGLTLSGAILERLAGPIDRPLKALVVKDIKTFFRDTTQWSQLFLLGALMVVYIYNFKALPLERFPFATFFLQNFISFLNLALAGFVISAVAVRFVFPAVSLEREAIWILRASPLGVRGFMWAKFWSAWAPIFILAETLTFLSNHYLRAGAFMTALSAFAIFFMTFGVTGLGIGLGAIYPKFRHENAAQISAGYGGVVFMLIATGFIAVVVALLAWPVYEYFTARSAGGQVSLAQAGAFALCLALVAVVNAACCIIPMRRGIKSLEEREL